MDKCVEATLKYLYEKNHFTWDEDLDLYSNYAAQLYGIPYNECLEWKNNKPYPIGRERRSAIKLMVLTEGILRGLITPAMLQEKKRLYNEG